MRYPNKHRKIKRLLPIVAAILVLGAGAVVFAMISRDDNTTTPSADSLPTAQSDFNGNEVKQQPNKTPDANASATDNNGSNASATPPSSQWTTSKDGSSIIVYSPSSNSKFSSGSTVYGTAKSSAVSYELEDTVSGVIAQGTANVVNGKFSVDFSFSTSASSGKINIFNQDPQGVVSNIVIVPVSFK